jgi:hypothetical protein
VKILVDTSVGSQARATACAGRDADRGRVARAHRRRAGRHHRPDPARLLSVIRTKTSFERLGDHVRSFEDEVLASEDFEFAAEHFNA